MSSSKMSVLDPPALSAGAPPTEQLDLRELYAEHADLIWANLYRMGVREPDLPDMLQEVLIVVHRRRGSYDPSASLRGWIAAICRKVASGYRRRAHRRRERLSPAPAAQQTNDHTPEHEVRARQDQERLAALLDRLEPEARAVLVMFEIEELSCAEIADALGVPVGTVHSRLHNARKRLRRAFRQLELVESAGRKTR